MIPPSLRSAARDAAFPGRTRAAKVTSSVQFVSFSMYAVNGST
jgi:hypothetical protein